MKQGFILFEVLIATAIMGMLSAVMFATLYQINQSVHGADDLIGTHTRIIIASRQFERDIAGAFAPQEEKTPPAAPQPPQSQGEAQKQTPAPAMQEKKEEKKLTKVFFSSMKHDNLDVLTFITNNPLQRNWAEGASGIPSPRSARIVYTLEAEKETRGKKPAYRLMRVESTNLDYDVVTKNAEKKYRAFELIDNIKSIKITYTPRPPKKKPQGEADKALPAATTKEITDWDSDSTLADESKRPREQLLPWYVTVTMVVWDTNQHHERTCVVTVPIIPDQSELPESQEAQKAKKVAEAQKKTQEAQKPSGQVRTGFNIRKPPIGPRTTTANSKVGSSIWPKFNPQPQPPVQGRT